MTRTEPLRLIIWQFSHLRLIDALTFISFASILRLRIPFLSSGPALQGTADPVSAGMGSGSLLDFTRDRANNIASFSKKSTIFRFFLNFFKKKLVFFKKSLFFRVNSEKRGK